AQIVEAVRASRPEEKVEVAGGRRERPGVGVPEVARLGRKGGPPSAGKAELRSELAQRVRESFEIDRVARRRDVDVLRRQGVALPTGGECSDDDELDAVAGEDSQQVERAQRATSWSSRTSAARANACSIRSSTG